MTAGADPPPLVTFRCVVDGCGKTLAGLFWPGSPGRPGADAGSPALGHYYDASSFDAQPGHPVLPTPDGPWWIHPLPLKHIVGLLGRLVARKPDFKALASLELEFCQFR